MELILQETLQTFPLFPEKQAMKSIYETFIKPESLYQNFKLEGLKANDIDLTDEEYGLLLSILIERYQIVQLKDVEIFLAWIIYSIKSKFGFQVSAAIMLQKLKAIFASPPTPLYKCVQFIAKAELKVFKQQKKWLQTHQSQVKKFSKQIEQNQIFASFMNLGKQVAHNKAETQNIISKPYQKPTIKEKVQQKNNQNNQFQRLELQKEGRLIFCEYQQMKTCQCLLQLQIQKYIFHYFIKIYKNMVHYNVRLCNVFEKQLPFKLISVKDLIVRIQQEKRMFKHVQQILQKIQALTKKIQGLQSQYTSQILILSSYQEILHLWNVLKENLNILNISFLNHLIRNTEKSISHIKDKNILFLIGPSGAGKTTIMLRLLGYKLTETKVHGLLTLHPIQPLLLEHSELITSPEAKSTTKYIFSAKINPEFVKNKKSEQYYEGQNDGQINKPSRQEWFLCDTPGFFDTSGPVVDIANGVGMINAVKSAKRVKPIVVISANMVGEKFEGIKQLGKIVSDLFLQYRKKDEGGSTAFIFNKFDKNQQFSRVQPGTANILKNLSPNEQSDGKYVRFLQVLQQKLRKKKDILKFDPFKVDIQQFISHLSDDLIEKPEDVFKYSFSTKSLMTLRSYFQNKINIINHLLNFNISHAYYHIKQLKQLLEIVPNEDFQIEFKSLIQKISNGTREYYMRFKYILNEQLLKNQVNSYDIQQLRHIYDKLTLYGQFNSIPQIQCYQKADLDELIYNASQNLLYALKGLEFTFIMQMDFKKRLKIIKSFSQNFSKNLREQIKKYLRDKYQSTKAQVERLAISNCFKQCRQMQQKYQNVCNYYEFIDGQGKKLNRFEDIMNERYVQIKSQAQIYLKDNSKIDSCIEKSLDITWKSIIELDTCYANLESMQIIYLCKARQQNFKSQITKFLVNTINFYSSRCQEIIHSKQICHENIKIFTRYRDSIQVISRFGRLKQQCDQAFKAISNSINRLLEQQLASLEKITDYMARSAEFSSKLTSFDISLFRIKSFGMLSDNMSLREKLQDIQSDLFTQLDKTIKGNLEKVKKMKINIRSNLKFDDINVLIKRQNELRYLKNIKNKQTFNNQEIDLLYFQEQVKIIEDQCHKQLTLPFLEFNQYFSAYLAQECILVHSKKHLHQLSSFIDYKNYLKKMMNPKDYERTIKPQLRQKYRTNFYTFMTKMQRELQISFELINQHQQCIFTLQKKSILPLKKRIDLLSSILKNENIENQTKTTQFHQRLSSIYKQFIVILEKNQRRLQEQFYMIKNAKDIQYRLIELHERCYKMKYFDRQLGQENNFDEILKLVNSEYSIRQTNAINKLIYVFNESNVNFILLQDFYTNNSTNPEIVHEILDKIKQYDRKFYQQIEGIKNFNDKLFENDNLDFVRIVSKTFHYYKETRSIIKDKIDDQNAILNLEYFRRLMQDFVDNYLQFYNKLMQMVFKFSFKQGIPNNYQEFFLKLQQLTKNFFPNDYEHIKKSIMQSQLQLELSLSVGGEMSITSYICRINNALVSEIQRDFSKVFNIFHPSSIKYYQHLDKQQREQYIRLLRVRFDKLIREYSSQMQKEGIFANDESKQIYQFLKLTPDKQIQQIWRDEIQLKEKQFYDKIQKAKMQFESELKKTKRNFKEMHSIYQKMSRNDKSKLKVKLRDAIKYDFQILLNSNLQLQGLYKQYSQLCQKYVKEQVHMTQFAATYEESKKSFLQILFDNISQMIKMNKNCIFEDSNAWSLQQTCKKNKSLTQLYLLSAQTSCIQDDLIDDINRSIEEYINSLIKLFKNEQFIQKIKTPLYYEVDISKLQEYIKIRSALYQLLLDIAHDLHTIDVRRHRSDRIAPEIIQFIEKSDGNQLIKPLKNLLQIILDNHKQVQGFKLDTILKEIEDNGDSIKSYHFQLEKLSRKLFFLQKFHQIYYRQNLPRFKITDKIDIFNCSRLAEKSLQKEKNQVIKEMEDLCKQSLTHKLSFRFAVLMDLCEVMRLKIRNDTDPFYFINSIRQALLSAFNKTISFQFGDPKIAQKLSQISSHRSKSITLTLSTNKQPGRPKVDNKYSNDAKTLVIKLVILEKMLSRSYPQQKLKQKIVQIIETFKKSSYLMPQVLNQLKLNLSISEIKKIAMKYKQFKSIFEEKFYENTKKELDDFLQELKKKNEQANLNTQDLSRQYYIYQRFFNETKNRYLRDPSQQTIKALSKEIIDKTNKDNRLNTLGRIFGLYSIIRSRQTSQGYDFHPHLAQVIAIILIFEEDQRYNGTKSCLLQIQTGQGKSIVLAGLACFLALKGYKVYQLCYSKYLVKRDYQNFKELFIQLQVQDKIQYTVFQDIFKALISKGKKETQFQEHLRDQINRDKGIIEKFFSKLMNFFFSKKEKNVLLMDEIDVIFSDVFQGQVYFPTVSFTDTDEKRQIREIFMLIHRQSKQNRLSLQRIEGSQEYQNLIKKYSNMENIIKDQVKKIVETAFNKQQIAVEQQNIKNNLKNRNNQNESSYKEMFAYLSLRENSSAVNQNILRKKLRINLKFGQFSYSQLPKWFERVIGVTGTLECLTTRKKRILENEYSVQNMYYIPSIYQKQPCILDKSLKTCANQQYFFKMVVQEITNHFNQGISSKRAIIIFFKDKRNLRLFSQYSFKSMRQNFNLNYLDEKPTDYNFQQINDRVGSVTSQNTLTLAIRQFTRGIDYKDFVLTDGLYVIQTYLPQNYEDFYQSKGRTARAGKNGRFKLILNSLDLRKIGLQTFEMSNIDIFWKQNDKKIEQKREGKRKEALQRHQRTLFEYNNNNVRSYVEQINRHSKKDYYIIICFQGTLGGQGSGQDSGLKEISQMVFNILQSYQDCIKKLELKINIKFQVCIFGNYSILALSNLTHNNKKTYQDGNNLIIRQSQLCQNVEDLRKFTNTYVIHQKITKGDCVQALLRHIKRKGKIMHIDSVFLWSDKVNYSWGDYTKTYDYQRVKDHEGIKPYIIKQDCEYYLNEIEKMKTQMTFMAKGSELTYKSQIEKFSKPFGKSSLKNLHRKFDDKELKAIFYERIKCTVPQLNTEQAIQYLEI